MLHKLIHVFKSVVVYVLLPALFSVDQGFSQDPAAKNLPELLRFEFSSIAMGSNLDMVLYAENELQAKQGVDAGIAEIERLSNLLSNYDHRSEISKLCNAPVGDSNPISQDLASVLSHSKRWHDLSDGSFDVTVGPLSKLWRDSRKQKRLPSPENIRVAKQRCGWEFVDFGTARSVSFSKPDMWLDLSGIAVGCIVDSVFERITETGMQRILINAGGDIRLGDAPPGTEGWKVTIAGLGKSSPPIAKRILKNCAVTTSGDLNQYVEIEGRRYSHFIDPKTGDPIERRQSVTAIASKTVDADAGATALAVLGASRANELFASMPLIEAILVEAELNGVAPIRLRVLTRD